MGYKEFIVDYIQSGNVVTLPNVLTLNCKRSTDAGSNALDITLHNHNNECYSGGQIKYLQNSILKVYAAEGFVNKSNPNHLIGVYTIQDYDEMADSNIVKLTCTDKTYNLLNKIFIGDETGRINELVNTVVQRVNIGSGVGTTPVSTNIVAVDSENNPFPSLNIVSSNKTAYEMLIELSQVTSTGDDKNYIFWFDENEQFHWVYPSDTRAGTFVYGKLPVIDIKTKRQETTTISTVFYNAGTDKNGSGIWRIYHDPLSSAFAQKYLPMTRIADDVRADLKRKGTYDTMDNDVFIEKVLKLALPKAQAYLTQAGKGIWEATINTHGRRYDIGGLYDVQFGRNVVSTRKMRLKNILHKMSASGWESTLTLEEDVIYGN